MQAYASNTSVSGSGEHYLALYGLLQAMVLQQDAVCNLDEALGGSGTAVGSDRHLQDIRKIRNVSVGHPTKVDRRDVMSHHHISRPKIGKGFELVSAYDDGRREFNFVSLSQLLRKQKLSVARMLRLMVQKLDGDVVLKSVKLKTKNELVQATRNERSAKPRHDAHRSPKPQRRNATVSRHTPMPIHAIHTPKSHPAPLERRRTPRANSAPIVHVERRRRASVPAATLPAAQHPPKARQRPLSVLPRRGTPVQSAPAFRRMSSEASRVPLKRQPPFNQRNRPPLSA